MVVEKQGAGSREQKAENIEIMYGCRKILVFAKNIFLGRGDVCGTNQNSKIMKTSSIILFSGQVFILISALCFLGVSLMAFNSPQSVMDMVGVQLTNTDALSSIRGVYGGVGLTLAIALIYLMRKDRQKGLLFLCILWGCYALSRVITIFLDGSLGAFGRQWLLTEAVFFFIALFLFLKTRRGNGQW